MAVRAARPRALFSGLSTGANLMAALRRAARLGAGHTGRDGPGRLRAQVPRRVALHHRLSIVTGAPPGRSTPGLPAGRYGRPVAGAGTYDDTMAALTAIVDRCATAGDRTGYFAAMYVAVTRTVRRRAGEGHFADPAQMERFVTGFAARYLAAEAAWRAGQPVGESWRGAFATAGQFRPIILQHLLLGMNAHINLDLAVAAADLAPDTGIEAVRADFDTINDVLGDLVDACQGALGKVSPWLGLVDRIGGSGDETMIRFSLVLARRQAWSAAVRLAARTARPATRRSTRSTGRRPASPTSSPTRACRRARCSPSSACATRRGGGRDPAVGRRRASRLNGGRPALRRRERAQ